MTRHRLALGTVLATLAFAPPLAAQNQDWQYRWWWGAKGGALGYTLPASGVLFVGQFGGEWMITAKRTALYIGFSQSPTGQIDTFRLTGMTQINSQVSFAGMRRIQLAVVVLPTNGAFQPYLGGGFVIETLTGPRALGTYNPASPSTPTAFSQTNQTTADRAIQNAASGGFALVMLGAQLRLGRKLALYGQFQGSPQGRDFLLSGSSQSFEGGLRYALLGAREDDVTTRR